MGSSVLSISATIFATNYVKYENMYLFLVAVGRSVCSVVTLSDFHSVCVSGPLRSIRGPWDGIYFLNAMTRNFQPIQKNSNIPTYLSPLGSHLIDMLPLRHLISVLRRHSHVGKQFHQASWSGLVWIFENIAYVGSSVHFVFVFVFVITV